MKGTTRCFRWALCAVLLLAAATPARSQWTAYTSMRGVTALSAAGNTVWAATTGGVFSYQADTGEIVRFTAVDGLYNVQSQAIAVDPERGVVWIGYRDGAIDRIDTATGAIETFFDIRRNDRFPSRQINRLDLAGDSLFVSTDFGLVVFDPLRGEVRDTYSRLGTLPAATPVYDALIAPGPSGTTLWLATDAGIVRAPLTAPNLQDPNVWTVEQTGLPQVDGAAPRVTALAYFAGRLYAGHERGLSVRQDDGSYTTAGITDQPVRDLSPGQNRLLVIDPFKAYALDAGGVATELLFGFLDLSSILEGPGGLVWIGDGNEGLNGLDAPPGQPAQIVRPGIRPEGPFDATFNELAFDEDGALWAASVGGFEGSGFYRLTRGGEWTDFTSRFTPALAGRADFTLIHVDSQGNVWAASESRGLAQVTPDGEILVYDHTNSSLQVTAGSDFVPISGVWSEADGTLWVANREAGLHVRTPDGAWADLPPLRCEGLSSTNTLDQVFVDSFGQKWITVLNPDNFQQTIGLIVLDDGADPADPDDDNCRFINRLAAQGTGLPNTQITSMTEDREGRVWISTIEGPAYVISSRVAAQDPSALPIVPQRADFLPGENPFLLAALRVNDIAVDPANRLWMATTDGAYLVEQGANGFTIVEHFTTANSPLFSNTVLTVDVRPATGEVFFGTDQGLLSFEGDAVAAAPSAGDLFVYPNPVRITGGTAPDIFIEGLVEETEVRIVAPHGEVVAQFPARGGRVRWDARDRNRALVPSGVYLVVAVGQNGEGAAYGKVAVIR